MTAWRPGPARWCAFAIGALALALSPAWAQMAAPGPDFGAAMADQIAAEALFRTGQGQPVFSSDGYRAGRIADVRVGPDSARTDVVVRLRPILGGGLVTLSLDRLRMRKGRVVAGESRAGLKALPRQATARAGRGR